MCESSLILQGKALNNKIYQIDLSEQYLLKCTDGSSCSGGYLENAIDKALKSGLPFETAFPYEPYSSNFGVCYTKDLLKVSNKTRVSRYHIDDNAIIAMLQDGPVVGAVSATGWEKYSTGVFSCAPNAQINHAVMIVGYTPNYWIIKNSWGTDYGIDGFIYVTRDPSSNCGIGTAIHELS
jgi:C1A family cysteine protease